MTEPCAPGSFIDLNYFITTFWCDFITQITTDDGYNQGGCNITYELNENNLIETVNIDDEIRLEIGYLQF